MLKAHQVTKDYQIRVLDHIDVSINDEEFVAIMGPSGSGKSTLLHALSGLDRPTSGTVSIDDCELTDLSEAELAQLRLVTFGFVFQQPHLLSSLSVLDNVVLPGFLAKQEPRQTIVERGRELMERVGIADLADRAITEASGGQLQRVGICRALINKPKILFGDEPTGALNSATSATILDIFHDINHEGTTIALVTHDPVVATHADRVLILVDGTIADDVTLGTYHPNDHQERLAHINGLMAARGV